MKKKKPQRVKKPQQAQQPKQMAKPQETKPQETKTQGEKKSQERKKPQRVAKATGRSKLRTLIIVLLCGVFLFSGVNVIRELLDYRQGEETYNEAEGLVDLPDFSLLPTPAPVPTAKPSALPAPTPAESGEAAPVESVEPTPTPTPYIDPYADALRAMDFAALREVNSEVIGWIIIPGTTVSYPLLQADNNSYYLNHTWKGKRSSVGAIFMECQSSPDLTDFHTIVYGHNMRNGSMFGALQNYRNQSHVDAHPSVYLSVDSGTYRYDIFAVYQANVDSNTYQIGFSGEKSRQTFLDDCLSRSVVSTGVTPHTYDRILTLSTCTNIGGKTIRWVVQAVCPGEEPVTEPPVPEETPAPPEPPIPDDDPVPVETPEPEETPAPSDTPTPTPTVSPTPTPRPTAAPRPTPTPTPPPSATPAPTPSPEVTPEPTVTPAPEETSIPEEPYIPGMSPAPTETPEPTPVPEETPKPEETTQPEIPPFLRDGKVFRMG